MDMATAMDMVTDIMTIMTNCIPLQPIKGKEGNVRLVWES